MPSDGAPWVRDIATIEGGPVRAVSSVVNPRAVWVGVGDTKSFITERADGTWRVFAPGDRLNGAAVTFRAPQLSPRAAK